MSSTKSQVAVATNIPNISSSNQSQQQQQQQKDYNSEESLGRQNSFGMNRRVSVSYRNSTNNYLSINHASLRRCPHSFGLCQSGYCRR